MPDPKGLLNAAVTGMQYSGYEGNISPLTKVRLLNFAYKEKSTSTCVNSVTYNPVTREMTIQFQQRGTYKYLDVPFDEYIEFETAGSRGTYFNLYVRDNYEYERVD